MNKRILMTGLISPVLASLMLAGCSKHDDTRTGSNPPGTTMAQAEQKANDLKSDTSQGLDRAKDATKSAMDSTKNAVEDAAITASVQSSLAKDKELSALAINVNTSAGMVALHGTAPSGAARDRATQLASAVKGVQSVDNQLTIKQ